MYRLWMNSILSLSLAVCCLGTAETLQAEILRLKESAVIEASLVRLGDVADVLNADAAETTRMQELILQPAPPQGRTQVITVSQIRGRLQALGVDLSRLELTGRSQIRVKKRDPQKEQNVTRTVTTKHDLGQAEEKVLSALTDWMKRHYQAADHFTLTVRIQPEDVPMIRDNRVETFQFSELDLQRGTEQLVALQFMDGQGMVRQTRFACQLKRVPEILAAKYTLNRGTVIRADDLIWIRAEQGKEGISDPSKVIGRELTRTVYQSQAIRNQELIQVPLVRNGSIVTVYARRGGISVRREMRARDDGAMGDPVTLVGLKGRDRLTATVTGFNQAEVNYRPAQQMQRTPGIQFISGSAAEPRASRTGAVQTAYEIRRGGNRK